MNRDKATQILSAHGIDPKVAELPTDGQTALKWLWRNPVRKPVSVPKPAPPPKVAEPPPPPEAEAETQPNVPVIGDPEGSDG